MKKAPILWGALCAAPFIAAAESPELEHVLVTVPVHKKQAATAIPVTVLSGEELRRQAAATLGETLEASPGLASASFGPGVGQPVIRGQQGPRVRVLQNGIRSFDASAISADHTVAVEPLLADSIEVLRGPATLLYGGGAIGGVVNVIDNRIPSRLPEEVVSGALEMRHDSVSDGNTAVLRGDGAVGSFAWHVDGVDRRWNDIDVPGQAFNGEIVGDLDESSDGFLRNSDGELQTWTAGGSHHFNSGYWGLAVNRMDKEYGIPPPVLTRTVKRAQGRNPEISGSMPNRRASTASW